MKTNAKIIVVKTNLSVDDYTEFDAECAIEGESHAAMLRRLMKSFTRNQKDKREQSQKAPANLGQNWALLLPGRSNYAVSMRSHQ